MVNGFRFRIFHSTVILGFLCESLSMNAKTEIGT